MESELLLTSFDSLHPCWTEKTLKLAGSSAAEAEELVQQGLLQKKDDIWFLSLAGREAFKKIASENYIDAEPGLPPREPWRAAKAVELLLLLDKAHPQRWGLKDYKLQPELISGPVPFAPQWEIKEGKLSWPDFQSSERKALLSLFPGRGLGNRAANMQKDAAAAAEWLKGRKTASFTPDLLYICHYDFIYYRDFKGHPNDPLKLINADRFFFVLDNGELTAELEAAAAFRNWTDFTRKVMLPGYLDIDTQEQDSVCWLLLASGSEKEALATAERLRPFSEELAEGVSPAEIWTISLEALASLKEKRELVWELLPDLGHPVTRAESGG